MPKVRKDAATMRSLLIDWKDSGTEITVAGEGPATSISFSGRITTISDSNIVASAQAVSISVVFGNEPTFFMETFEDGHYSENPVFDDPAYRSVVWIETRDIALGLAMRTE